MKTTNLFIDLDLMNRELMSKNTTTTTRTAIGICFINCSKCTQQF